MNTSGRRDELTSGTPRAVITSMYPTVTVGLAGLTLRERISGQQLAGVAIAAVSVVLIALG
jgi:drug/metabolite transporter (DMT)-like permease